MGNQNQYIEGEQTTQWPRDQVQNEKQRSTKHTHKTKTRTPLKTRGERMCSGRVKGSCSTNKPDRHDITEILLKVALNTIKQTKNKCIA